jgi:hypothetical protein
VRRGPVGPPPALPVPARAAVLPAGTVIEVSRTVDVNGTADLARQKLKVGAETGREGHPPARESSGHSPGFAPRGYPQRTPGRGQSLAHWTGTTSPTSADPPSTSSTHRMRPRVARQS